MTKRYSRRVVLQGAAACAGLLLTDARSIAEIGAESPEVEIQIAFISAHTLRLSILPIKNGRSGDIPVNGSLRRNSWGPPAARLRGKIKPQTVRSDTLQVEVSGTPPAFTIKDQSGRPIQRLVWAPGTGVLMFDAGASPLLGLGEGGPQFDRRGSTDPMISGQGGYKLATHGGRVPIPWLIGTSGWAAFLHQPFGTFDFTGDQCKFQPTPGATLPVDVFVVAAQEPATIMAEYARLTGNPELPPLWSLGYQQSHRTLASREEVLEEAKTFREKKLPCDALIYLGTGFCPSGWNTANGSFVWNSHVFPDPKKMIAELHAEHFRVVPHAVILSDRLRGGVTDPCALDRFDEADASCYWDAHRQDFAMGVDGWWPDEGDPLDIPSTLTRHRMYWEGPQLDRPNERPYALHRNGYAGMQRYGSFLWSGDVFSTWETLKVQVPIGINSGLTGVPYWGTDIGGFVPTKEFTAELYLRWFQFGSFCTLFRSHGRTWKLRLPWGWNTGDAGPIEINNYQGAATPDPSELHNPEVETICRKYLELRYRLLPYLYSVIHECTRTGMPVMRALWLHYPDDPKAVACGDQYLWGPNLLIAPVIEKGARVRRVYLPRGDWYDFWTGERLEGGREVVRDVDLATMPIYARAGSIVPFGPVKQYTGQEVDEPLSVSIYPGGDASFLLYEDDGKSFNYRKGEWMGAQLRWDDKSRTLALSLAEGSRMLAPKERKLDVRIDRTVKRVLFSGLATKVEF